MNPFDPARPAGPLFVGRSFERRALACGLAAGKSFALIGGAGMGKTSLLRVVEEDLGRTTCEGPAPLAAYVRCDRGDLRGPSDLFARMADELAEAVIRRAPTLTVPAGVRAEALGEAAKERLPQALARILDWLHGQTRLAHRPLFLLDDLHRLVGQPWLPELASHFNAFLDRHLMALVLTGKEALDEELRSDVSKLRHLVTDRIHIPPLDVKDVEDLLTHAQRVGCAFGTGCARRLHQLTGGHPYRVQYYLYRLAASRRRRITVSALDDLHQRPETQHHLRELLGDPPPAQAMT
jgi:hypothetical protein